MLSYYDKNKNKYTKPLPVNLEELVPFELLYAQLNNKGKVSTDDFFAQSRLALQTANVEDFDQITNKYNNQ